MTTSINIQGMTCASCVRRIEVALQKVAGVHAARVSLLTEKAEIDHDLGLDPTDFVHAIVDIGYQADLNLHKTEPQSLMPLKRRWIFSLAIGAAMMLEMLVSGNSHHRSLWQILAATGVQFWAGAPFYSKAWAAARAQTTTMDTLVVLGSSVAYFYSLLSKHPYFESSVFIIGFVLLGRWLEAHAKNQARASLTSLLQASPDLAHRLLDGQQTDVLVSQLKPGDCLRVLPGETIPVDGTILEGSSSLNEALVTGESSPVFKTAGDSVIGATLNGQGSFLMTATAVGSDTVLASIARSVERAQSQKAPIQQRVDRIASIFVPAILVLAALNFLFWLPAWELALQTSVAVLLIACPCAMGLAVPVAHMVGLGKAASLGILVRNPEALEKAAKVDVVVLDKTGTVTQGQPQVAEVRALPPFSPTEVLRLAAALETHSEHPLAGAVVAHSRPMVLPPVNHFQAIPGQGVEGTVEGKQLRMGSSNFVNAAAEHDTRTRMFLEVDGQLAGWLAVSDTLRPDARQAVLLLSQGRQLWLLSGDRQEVAQGVADELDIPHVRGGLLPHDKQRHIQELQDQGHIVAMIGDGLNDTPALAQADVSVALGWGSDLARETADLTLLQPRLERLDDALRLSKAISSTVSQGLLWAFLYNLILIPVAAAALLNPVLAALAMTASSLSVVANALRLRRFV